MKNVFKLAAIAAAFTFSANLAQANDKIGFADPGYLLQNHPAMLEAAAKIEKMVEEGKSKFADEEKKLSDEDKALSEEYKKIDADAKKLQQEQASVEASLKKKIEALEKDAPRLRAKEIQARQNAIQAEQKAFQNKVAAIQKREADFRKKADAFQKKVNAFQEKIQKLQPEGTVDTVAVQKKAVEEINATVKTVADAKGYSVVLYPSAAFYVKDEKSADLTEEVLNTIKAKYPAPAVEVKPVEAAPAAEKPAEAQAK